MPGFGLDTLGPPRFQTTPGWPPCEPPPGVALPRAHHLHVARPPVRVYESAARKAQRIKQRPKRRNKQSEFTPLSLGRESRATASRNMQHGVQFREHRHRHSVRTQCGSGASAEEDPGETRRLTRGLTTPYGNGTLPRKLAPTCGDIRFVELPPSSTPSAVGRLPPFHGNDRNPRRNQVRFPFVARERCLRHRHHVPGRCRRRRRSASQRRPQRGAATIGPRPSAKAGSR